MANFDTLEPQRHPYSLDVEFKRDNPFWQRSTDVHTIWGFPSQTTKSDHQVLPLMQVGFGMALSDTNTAPAGAYSFGLKLSMPLGVTAVPVLAPRVEVSWDGGTTWADAALSGCHAGKVTGSAGQVTQCAVQRLEPGVRLGVAAGHRGRHLRPQRHRDDHRRVRHRLTLRVLRVIFRHWGA